MEREEISLCELFHDGEQWLWNPYWDKWYHEVESEGRRLMFRPWILDPTGFQIEIWFAAKHHSYMGPPCRLSFSEEEDGDFFMEEFREIGKELVDWIAWWLNESGQAICEGIPHHGEYWQEVTRKLASFRCPQYPRRVSGKETGFFQF